MPTTLAKVHEERRLETGWKENKGAEKTGWRHHQSPSAIQPRPGINA